LKSSSKQKSQPLKEFCDNKKIIVISFCDIHYSDEWFPHKDHEEMRKMAKKKGVDTTVDIFFKKVNKRRKGVGEKPLPRIFRKIFYEIIKEKKAYGIASRIKYGYSLDIYILEFQGLTGKKLRRQIKTTLIHELLHILSWTQKKRLSEKRVKELANYYIKNNNPLMI